MLKWVTFAYISSQYTQGLFIDVAFLGQRVWTFVIWIAIAAWPSAEAVAIDTSAGNVWKALFFHTLATSSFYFFENKTLWSLPIWQEENASSCTWLRASWGFILFKFFPSGTCSQPVLWLQRACRRLLIHNFIICQ